MLLAIAQQAQVVARTERRFELDADAVASELLRVALAELGIAAAVGTGGEYHAARRRRVEKQVGGDDERDADERKRPPRHREVAHRDQRLANDARHLGCGFFGDHRLPPAAEEVYQPRLWPRWPVPVLRKPAPT